MHHGRRLFVGKICIYLEKARYTAKNIGGTESVDSYPLYMAMFL